MRAVAIRFMEMNLSPQALSLLAPKEDLHAH